MNLGWLLSELHRLGDYQVHEIYFLNINKKNQIICIILLLVSTVFGSQ